jgi:zinc transport system permease protein
VSRKKPQDEFILRALAAGLGVALIAGPLGVFLIWPRMAYFGDTLAHSALLGVALGFLLGVSVILLSVSLALLLAGMQGTGNSPATPNSASSPTAPSRSVWW